MAFGGFDQSRRAMPMAEINVVPLVDVMLVLLVVFIITTPLLTHAVKIDLPKAASQPNLTQNPPIVLAIRPDGSLFWNDQPMTLAELPARFAAAAPLTPQPELHIHADQRALFGPVAQVLSAAGRAGLVKIGFVTDPGKVQ